MNKLFSQNSIDPTRWNERIVSLNGPMQLTTEWSSFVCAKDNLRPFFFQSDHGDNSVASIIYLSSSSQWPLSRWPSAHTDCIPLADDRSAVIFELEFALHRLGVSDLQLNSFAYDVPSPIQLTEFGYEETARYEFVLTLQNGIEAVWLGTRPTLRNDIRRFERSGIVCRARSEKEVISVLHKIEMETALRHRANGKHGNPMRRATYESLWTHVVSTGRAHVYTSEKDGEPIASVVIGVCGSNAYYLYGGATYEGLASNAPKGLLWFAIQQEYANGIREFNLGGMAATAANPDYLDHGLFKFKSAFGATQRSCISGHKKLRPKLVATKNEITKIAHKLRTVLKGTGST